MHSKLQICILTIVVAFLSMVSNGCQAEMPIATDVSIRLWELDTIVASVQPEDDPEHPKKPEPITNTEMHLTFNVTSGVTEDNLEKWLNKTYDAVRNTRDWDLVILCHNILDSPQKKWIASWTSIGGWTEFAKSTGWQSALAALQTQYANEIHVELWKSERMSFAASPEPDTRSATQNTLSAEPETEHPVKPEPFANVAVEMTFNITPQTSSEKYQKWLIYANSTMRTNTDCSGVIAGKNIMLARQCRLTSWWDVIDQWVTAIQKKELDEVMARLSSTEENP
jgi:hypothetical protein